MKLMHTTAALALCIAAAFALQSGGCKKDDPAAGNVIKIGHVASLTGDTATFGVSADEGIKLAMEEINAKGGVLGKHIHVVTLDDRSQNDEAKTAAQKLIDDGVVALLGEIASSRSIQMAPVAQGAKVPMLSPGSTNPKVTEIGDYVFRACFIDPFQGTAMADFAMAEKPKGLGLKKFAVLYPVNSDYGKGLRDYFIAAVKKNGGEIVEDLSYTEKSDVDFKSQLTKIRNSNPDAIYMSGYYTEAGLVAQQARELGITVPLLGGDGWDSDKTLTVGKQAIEGCYFTNHYSPDEQRPEVQAFVDAYKKKYNKVPDAMAILGYDAMKLMANAIERAGSAEPTKIRDALAATKDFPGAAGKITIDAQRNAKKNIVVLKIENGKFNFVTSVEPS